MKKSIVLVAIIAMGLLLAGCGVHQNELDMGHSLVEKGDCAGAAPYLEDTIAQPDEIMDLALAYFLKGKCAEDGGDAAKAYENYYAAKIVACYAVSHDTHVNLNTYARTEYCERLIPQKLSQLAPDVGDAAKIKAIEEKVDSALTARYMSRFDKRLN